LALSSKLSELLQNIALSTVGTSSPLRDI